MSVGADAGCLVHTCTQQNGPLFTVTEPFQLSAPAQTNVCCVLHECSISLQSRPVCIWIVAPPFTVLIMIKQGVIVALKDPVPTSYDLRVNNSPISYTVNEYCAISTQQHVLFPFPVHDAPHHSSIHSIPMRLIFSAFVCAAFFSSSFCCSCWCCRCCCCCNITKSLFISTKWQWWQCLRYAFHSGLNRSTFVQTAGKYSGIRRFILTSRP